MKIFSGSANKPLAEKVAKQLSLELSPIELFVFPDGEKRIQIQESVVDEHCVVVQPTSTPVAENYMELFFIIDGLKRSGASEVTVVMPYVGYQRQDHVFRSGEAVSLDVVIQTMEALGVSKIIALDFHSIKIPELFHIPVVQLSAMPLFADVIATPSARNDDCVLVSPDMGGLRRISKMSELLNGMPWIATVKDRDLATGKIEIKSIDGQDKDMDLDGKEVFMVDDMISSGGTIVKAAQLLKEKGVTKVSAFVTHPIFSQEAPTLLQESILDAVYVTDGVFVPEEKHFPKLHVLSIAEMVATSLQETQ